MCPKESVDYCAFDSTALYTVSTGSSWTLVRDYWTLVHSCTILTQKHLIFKSNLLPKDICTEMMMVMLMLMLMMPMRLNSVQTFLLP